MPPTAMVRSGVVTIENSGVMTPVASRSSAVPFQCTALPSAHAIHTSSRARPWTLKTRRGSPGGGATSLHCAPS